MALLPSACSWVQGGQSCERCSLLFISAGVALPQSSLCTPSALPLVFSGTTDLHADPPKSSTLVARGCRDWPVGATACLGAACAEPVHVLGGDATELAAPGPPI